MRFVNFVPEPNAFLSVYLFENYWSGEIGLERIAD